MSKARPTEFQAKMLCRMMGTAFVEIRFLAVTGNAEQASALADAFHNLPYYLFSDDFDWDFFRNAYLLNYQKRFPHHAWLRDYVTSLDKIRAGKEIEP